MGFNINTNYGPNIEVNEGGVVNLHQDRNGLWATIDAEEAQIVNEVEDLANDEAIVNKLKPIFYGVEDDAREFLVAIRGMKPTEITETVKRYVAKKKISEKSCRHDLWKVLNDSGLYNRTESNWNMQVK